MRTQTVKDANQTRTNGKSLEVRTLSGSEHYFSGQARIYTGFRRFMEIGQIFHNVSGTQEVDFGSPKDYLGGDAPDPSRSFHLWHLFRKSVTIYPRSVPDGKVNFISKYAILSMIYGKMRNTF